MDAPRANPLYHQWLAVASLRRDDVALREASGGREFSFAELRDLAAKAAPGPPLLHSTARGLGLILDVLRAWRDGSVLIADDGSGVPPPPLRMLQPGICHLKVTSGSTGAPRHVQFRAEQLAADAAGIVTTMGLRVDWPNLGVISMAHSYGFSNLVLPLLLHGVPLWLLDNPLPETLRRALDTHHPLTLAAVPAMWQAWDRVGVDFTPVRLAISAGAPLPITLEAAVFTRTGLKIHNFYGSSECGGIAYDRSPLPRTQPSLAGTPMDGVSVACDPASGCLRITSAAVAEGYVAAGPTPDAAAGPGGGTWLAHDLARIAEHGAVHLLGRAGEFISVAGHKLAPTVIEEVLLRIPGVRCCVVFGVPSPNEIRVEDMVACVNLAAGTDIQVLKHAFQALPSTYCPRHWWQCADLQPDERGKLSRKRWRDRWLAEMAGKPTRANDSPNPPPPDPARGWRAEVWQRLRCHFVLKTLGISAFIWVFFIGYFHVLRHPAHPVTLVPVTALDQMIPFQPVALVPYLSLWFYLGIAPGLLLTYREILAYGLWIAAMCGVGLACFHAWPTAVPPLELDLSGHAGFAMLQSVDATGNACPSLHVATAMFTAIWLDRLLRMLRMRWGLRAANAAVFAAIAYSTLATKQHLVLDALAGAALGAVFALAAWHWRPRLDR